MPCRDVDEVLTLTLDRHDRLVEYRLSKRTCGAAVGAERLLLDWFAGWAPAAIHQVSSEELEARYRVEDDARAFLYFKHLFALRGALSSLVGDDHDDAFTIESVEVSPDDGSLRVRALVAVELLAERIRSCGGCGTCRPRSLPVIG